MLRTVNSLYPIVNSHDNRNMSTSQHDNTAGNITVTRRLRLHELLSVFVQAEVAQGQPPKGLEQAFAAKLQVSPSLLSQIKKSRPISDKVARQIEVACDVPLGWLDTESPEPAGPTPAEEAFIALARARWRKANAKEKRALMRLMKAGEDLLIHSSN